MCFSSSLCLVLTLPKLSGAKNNFTCANVNAKMLPLNNRYILCTIRTYARSQGKYGDVFSRDSQCFKGKQECALRGGGKKISLVYMATVTQYFVMPPTEMAKHANDVINRSDKETITCKQTKWNSTNDRQTERFVWGDSIECTRSTCSLYHFKLINLDLRFSLRRQKEVVFHSQSRPRLLYQMSFSRNPVDHSVYLAGWKTT